MDEVVVRAIKDSFCLVSYSPHTVSISVQTPRLTLRLCVDAAVASGRGGSQSLQRQLLPGLLSVDKVVLLLLGLFNISNLDKLRYQRLCSHTRLSLRLCVDAAVASGPGGGQGHQRQLLPGLLTITHHQRLCSHTRLSLRLCVDAAVAIGRGGSQGHQRQLLPALLTITHHQHFCLDIKAHPQAVC